MLPIQKFLIATASLFGVMCVSIGTAIEEHKILTCSVIQLIANPDQFDGEQVRTYGFATIGFERNHLYLSREDAKHGLLTNAVLLDLPTIAETQRHAGLDGKYVLVEGRFDASHKDGFVPANGGIRQISRLELVEPMLTIEDLPNLEREERESQ